MVVRLMKSVKHMGFLTFNQSVAFLGKRYHTVQLGNSEVRQAEITSFEHLHRDSWWALVSLHLMSHFFDSNFTAPRWKLTAPTLGGLFLKCDNKKPLCYLGKKKKKRFDKREDSCWGGWSEIIGLDSSFPFHTEEGVLLPRFGSVPLETENEYAVGRDEYTEIKLEKTFITLLLAYTLVACWQT